MSDLAVASPPTTREVACYAVRRYLIFAERCINLDAHLLCVHVHGVVMWIWGYGWSLVTAIIVFIVMWPPVRCDNQNESHQSYYAVLPLQPSPVYRIPLQAQLVFLNRQKLLHDKWIEVVFRRRFNSHLSITRQWRAVDLPV